MTDATYKSFTVRFDIFNVIDEDFRILDYIDILLVHIPGMIMPSLPKFYDVYKIIGHELIFE